MGFDGIGQANVVKDPHDLLVEAHRPGVLVNGVAFVQHEGFQAPLAGEVGSGCAHGAHAHDDQIEIHCGLHLVVVLKAAGCDQAKVYAVFNVVKNSIA
ncbi:hypothetical protein D9M68_535000 [compost metagenome]